jgi:hypothetical protein
MTTVSCSPDSTFVRVAVSPGEVKIKRSPGSCSVLALPLYTKLIGSSHLPKTAPESKSIGVSSTFVGFP